VTLIAVVLAITSACATRRFTPPNASPVPLAASEAGGIWLDATRACVAVRSYNGEIRPSGRVADARVRGLTLFVGVDDQDRMGIEAEAGSRPVFTLKGTTRQATLWLPQENRVVEAPAHRMLDAIVGLELGASRLLALFSGCIASNTTIERADRLGQVVRVTTPDAVVYLERDGEHWMTRAGAFGDLIVDYPQREGEWPDRILVRTAEGRVPRVDLSLEVAARVINREFPPGTFVVSVPAGAVPASVEDLRLIGSE
jgi:hypothetical protein